MSGGGGGGGRGGAGMMAQRNRQYGVDVNVSGISQSALAEAPRRSTGRGLGSSARNGEAKTAQLAGEPARATPPVSKGPSGVDTGGATTDVAAADAATRLAQSASAMRRRRASQARGGGLSNVRFGGATLG